MFERGFDVMGGGNMYTWYIYICYIGHMTLFPLIFAFV